MTTVNFSLMNLAVKDEVRLSSRVVLRPMEEDYLKQVYLCHQPLHPVEPDWSSAPWRLNHNVESVFDVDDDVDPYGNLEKREEIIAPLLFAVRLSRIRRMEVYPSHMRAVSSEGAMMGLYILRTWGSAEFNPAALSPGEIAQLQEAFSIVEGVYAEDDRVLQTALDRLMVGMSQGVHHPLRINRPNWDRVVDYVICLETLLLTAHEQQRTQESLSYRLSFNGAALLSKARPGQRPSVVFEAMKAIYTVRSKIVHGESQDTILKVVNKFLSIVKVSAGSHNHPIGRLSLTCQTLEDWIYWMLQYLVSIPAADRPFAKRWGWEELLGTRMTD